MIALNLNHHLDHRLRGKTDNTQTQGNKYHRATETPGTGFLRQPVHNIDHVQHQSANTQCQRTALEGFDTDVHRRVV